MQPTFVKLLKCRPVICSGVQRPVKGGVLAQRAHSAGTARICQGEIGGVTYYWQYSCLYRPYYNPTMLDGLMFHPTPTPQASQVSE